MKKKQENHGHPIFSSLFLIPDLGDELILSPGLVYSFPVMDDLRCVMLAAGGSTRMDSWKMVLPWGSSTIIEHSAWEPP